MSKEMLCKKCFHEEVCSIDGRINECKHFKNKTDFVEAITLAENKCEDCAGCSVWKCDCSNIRNQALEEFYEKLKQKEETSEDYTKWVSMKNIKIVFDELMKEIKDKENKKELSNFINEKMQKQENKISLPNEMYRYMFDNNNKAVPVKCKVGKILRDGFTLIHVDKREWKFLYSDIRKHVWYTEEEVLRYIEEAELNK